MSDGDHSERAKPADVREWLEIQRDRSAIPAEDEMLLETFPRGQRNFLVAYPFEGRLAHTTLAMLLTRRLERLGIGPMGFCVQRLRASGVVGEADGPAGPRRPLRRGHAG